jgi:RNA polymerase sigma-70 factor, ECF subfamily
MLDWMRRVSWLCWRNRIARDGIMRRFARRCRWWKKRCEAVRGPFALQAAIAALHCQAAQSDDTDWPQILRLYDVLQRTQPSPVVALNRAVAVAMVEGPDAGLKLVDHLEELDDYHLLHAARADLLRRAGRNGEASVSYERTLALVTNASERQYLEQRLREAKVYLRNK